MATIHQLGRDKIHTYWSNALPPALTIQPGDIVTVLTQEASDGNVSRKVRELAQPGLDPELIELIAADAFPERDDPLRDPNVIAGHPLTGPIAIDGAEPGDTLVVQISHIRPHAWGYAACSSNPRRLGLINDLIGDDVDLTWYFDLRNTTYTDFMPGIRIPVGPHPGVVGVAPAEDGQFDTIPPRANGGNMDIRHIQPGSTLLLPVLVPGALFSIGDVHFAMGDGEVSGYGIEMNAEIGLRFQVSKGEQIPGPQLLTNGQPLSIPGPAYVTTGFHSDVREAARIALRAMLDVIIEYHEMTLAEAYLLASIVVDLKISQLVDRPNWTVAAYLPLSIFEGD